ncbi:MAG: DUF624 domain-containing protein [Clostridia bacterium]|nr:DUF624 domain-containing protein [Clostridia bacterium]
MSDTEKKNRKLPKHLLYSIFNPSGGKGLTKAEAKRPRDLKGFFSFFWNNFNMMFALNIFFVLGNFPILFGALALSGSLDEAVIAPASSLAAPLFGITSISGFSPATLAIYGVHGVGTVSSLPTVATSVFAWMTVLVILTFGLVNTATVYVMRNIVKGDPTSFADDVIHAIKRNFRQAMIFGVIDAVLIAMMAYDLVIFFLGGSVMTAFAVFFGVMVIVALMYSIMRYYIYVQLVTFDLSIWKMFKNSFNLAALGIKRNVLAILGMVLAGILEAALFMTVLMPVGVILPLLILVSFVNFAGVYAAYPVVKKYMIDPYYVSDDVGAKTHEAAAAEPEPEPEEPIFIDRG